VPVVLEAVTGRDHLVIDSADGDCKIAHIPRPCASRKGL